MDGKHNRIDPPLKSGSLYYIYKDTFSIVVLAVVDSQLRFIRDDIGTNGRISDKGVWNKCTLKRCLDENFVHNPPPSPLPNVDNPFPYVIVGDEGFMLSLKVLIPFPKEQARAHRNRKIFNYRLSRARCSENAFGVMASRFQILRSPMRYDPDDARVIVLAILCLHNLLRTDSVGKTMYSPPEFLDYEGLNNGQIIQGDWRRNVAGGFAQMCHQGGNRHAADALALRNEWAEYFSGPGSVPWQDCMITVPHE